MNSPVVDKRTYKEIIQQIKVMAPYYTPEWKFNTENPDAGTALFMVVALQMEETVGLLNQTFDNHFTACLNLMNLKIRPSTPARVPLVFKHSVGARETVEIQKGTRVFGRSEISDSLLSYESETRLTVHPVAVQKCIETDPTENRITDWPLEETMTLGGGGPNIQQNCIEILAPCVCDMTAPSLIKLFIDVKRNAELLNLLISEEHVAWQYESGDEWTPFDGVALNGSVIVLERGERKTSGEISGRIRCTAKPQFIGQLENLHLSGLRLASEFDPQIRPLSPTAQFCNISSVTEENLYPFGPLFNVTGSWMICSKDVFGRKGARIHIRFNRRFEENRRTTKAAAIDWKLVMKKSQFERMKEPVVSILDVKWKYFNGYKWVNLEVGLSAERCFYCQNADEAVNFSFICPEDIAPFEMEGSLQWGIKAEITRIDNEYAANGVFMSPVVSGLTLDYGFIKPVYPDRVLIQNNLETEDITTALGNSERAIQVFKAVEMRNRNIYLMFDSMENSGNISLLMLLEQSMDRADRVLIRAEAAHIKNREVIWTDIHLDDDTGGLTRTGIVTLLVDRKLMTVKCFGETGVWIRLSFAMKDGSWRQRRIRGIIPNGVWGCQVFTVENEVLEYQEERCRYLLSTAPVRDVEVFVNEIWNLSQAQAEELLTAHPKSQWVRNEYGMIDQLWVPWAQVDSLLHCGHDNRVFLVDCIKGEIVFGDGKNGMRLPKGDGNHVRVNYRTTAGSAGNVESFSIRQMETAKAFLDGVENPDAALGGCDYEPVSSVRQRGLQKIRTRGIPVSPEDYEQIIVSEFPSVYRIRCYPNTDRTFSYRPGHILLVAASLEQPENAIDDETRTQIMKYLQRRVPVSLPLENIALVDPVGLEISVRVKVKLSPAASASEVERQIDQTLRKFLNHHSGGRRGAGFPIGQLPEENHFYSLFSGIEGVSHLEKLSFTWVKEDKELRSELSWDGAKGVLNSIVRSGKHQIEFSR